MFLPKKSPRNSFPLFLHHSWLFFLLLFIPFQEKWTPKKGLTELLHSINKQPRLIEKAVKTVWLGLSPKNMPIIITADRLVDEKGKRLEWKVVKKEYKAKDKEAKLDIRDVTHVMDLLKKEISRKENIRSIVFMYEVGLPYKEEIEVQMHLKRFERFLEDAKGKKDKGDKK